MLHYTTMKRVRYLWSRGQLGPGRFAALTAICWPRYEVLLGGSTKTDKGLAQGVATKILYLSPGFEAVPYTATTLCAWQTRGCRQSCLGHSAGRMRFSANLNARLWKTIALYYAPLAFTARLKKELVAHYRLSSAKGLLTAARLNGSSDKDWTGIALWAPDIKFYEYTRSYTRAIEPHPSNLHVTFSRGEFTTPETIRAVLRAGTNVAVVFGGTLPRTYLGYSVINGDLSDVRFRDPRGVIVGLTAKGKARQDTTGFVVRSL